MCMAAYWLEYSLLKGFDISKETCFYCDWPHADTYKCTLNDTTVGFVYIQTARYLLKNTLYRLGFAYLGQVCLGIGSIWCCSMHWTTWTFWNFLLQCFGLFRPIGLNRWLLAGLLYPMKYTLSGMSRFALRYTVFYIAMHFWHFGHCGSCSHLIW